jgi:hypothetical protein
MAGDVLIVTSVSYIQPEFRDSTLIFLINDLFNNAVSPPDYTAPLDTVINE